MAAVISVLVVVTLSLLVIRVGAAALGLTGLSRDVARFQAYSAFAGVGFTTHEAEQVVNHPVRRRIIMLLMILGNAGIVTAVSSVILTFVREPAAGDWVARLFLLVGGVALLILVASSRWVDRGLSRVINWALHRWTDLEVHDYVALLHLTAEYGIRQFTVKKGSWLAGKTLQELALPEEGVLVLAIQYGDREFVASPTGASPVRAGDQLVLYGRLALLEDLGRREADAEGAADHAQAVAEHRLRREHARRVISQGRDPSRTDSPSG